MTVFIFHPPCSKCFATSGREGINSLRRSTVLPLTQPELPNLELFFYPQKFWRSPHTSSWRHGKGARCAACVRVCKRLGGEMLTECPYLSVKRSENMKVAISV